jgi:hypothetical protein
MSQKISYVKQRRYSRVIPIGCAIWYGSDIGRNVWDQPFAIGDLLHLRGSHGANTIQAGNRNQIASSGTDVPRIA